MSLKSQKEVVNAASELLELVGDSYALIEAAKLTYESCCDGGPLKDIILKKGYSLAEYQEFLMELNFEYDSGFGIQELSGTIWFDDGTWATRGEYDGSEWWIHHKRPAMPVEVAL